MVINTLVFSDERKPVHFGWLLKIREEFVLMQQVPRNRISQLKFPQLSLYNSNCKPQRLQVSPHWNLGWIQIEAMQMKKKTFIKWTQGSTLKVVLRPFSCFFPVCSACAIPLKFLDGVISKLFVKFIVLVLWMSKLWKLYFH